MKHDNHPPHPEFRSPVKGVVFDPADTGDVRRQKMARVILDSMYQFLGLLDVDGTVLEINSAALEGAGLCLEEVVGKPFWKARWWEVSPEVRHRVKKMIAQARAGRFVRCDFEVFGELRGSKTILIDFSLTPIRAEDGSVVFLLPEGRNITEKITMSAELSRKNLELQKALEKLRELDSYKTKFFANVSHELRTPLALILGPVDQLLKDGSELGERERFRLATIKRNAQYLLQQVNDLLDLARIDSGLMPMAYVCANVSGMVTDIAAGFFAQADQRSIAFALDTEGELYADIDRAKFARIIGNLLSNAFKFTPVGGRIVCSVRRSSESRVLVSVRDTGPGVPDEAKTQIFDRFQQGSCGDAALGTGLGLNIVKDFVELHQGTVSVMDAVGGGADFQVELPIRAPAGVAVRPAPESPGTEASFQLDLKEPAARPFAPYRPGEPRVLVAEDNPDLRLFLYDVLVDEYNLRMVEDGAQALAAVLEDAPDLVITDLMMPHLDGERFVRELRAIRGIPHVPVLVLSAKADDALREDLLVHLVQDYLTKPFSPQELRARVKNLVSVKRTVDLLQKELNSQASDIEELTAGLVNSRKVLLDSLRALQISERRWQGMYDNTAVGIALADRRGCILSANPALQAMLGYGPAEIVGISFMDITEESQRAMTERSVNGLFDGSIARYQVEKRYERKDGRYLWANVSVSLIPAVDEDGPRLAVIVEDITSRKEAETALARTRSELARVARFTAMGELAASIAHEVNQPLSAIISNSDAAMRWLTRDPPNHEEVLLALGRVGRDASHAGAVITRIRKFLRAGEIHKDRIALRPVADELLRMLNSAIVDAEVEVDLQIPPDLPDVWADPVQLQQVLLNLVVNALDAMRDIPKPARLLAISARNEGLEGVLVSVSDTGNGIPPESRERIFDAFVSTKPDGLGMGLAISRTIIENHGGRLWLDETWALGTRFRFTLPGS